MKKFYTLLLVLFSTGMVFQLNAQKRYLEPVFDEVEIGDVEYYGQNYTILTLLNPQIGHTFKQPLPMQVYKPKGDEQTNRPLVIYLHTGNFLPFPLNASCGGRLNDPCVIEMASRMAKMGYVVAVADYRQGWNPIAEQEAIRRYTLINGAYRGVQDLKTCVRYFRRSVAEFGNKYGIDPDKITVMGQGTGGYTALGAAYIDDIADVLTTSDPTKFFVGNVPMVIEAYNGTPEGLVDNAQGPCVVDATYNAATGIPIGDTLCISNHEGYSSEVQLAVNMGGALGDSLWIDEDEVPLISFHVVDDTYAPCATDVLNVGTASGPQPVVEVSGSCDVQRIANRKGLNDIFNTIPEGNDPYGDAIRDNEGYINSFYPLVNTPNGSSAPWEWNYEDDMPQATDCNFDQSLAMPYLDTIIGYFAPRACVALDLPCQFTSTKEVVLNQDYIAIAPNPANGYFEVSSDKATFDQFTIYSMEGRIIDQRTINATQQYRYDALLPTGMYFIKVRFEDGIASQKLIIE